MLTEDPFEFGEDDDAPIFIKKTPPQPPGKRILPSVKKTPRSVKRQNEWLSAQKKTPRVVISRNNDEVNEMLDIKRAIEESKKTALREDRARRYENRLLQKTPPSGAVSSGSESNNGVHLPSKTQEPLITILAAEEDELTESKKYSAPQEETFPNDSENSDNDSTPVISQQDTPVKPKSITKDVGPSSSRESSVTPILKQTSTSKISQLPGDASSLPSSNRLKLKRKRLPNISKEPAIKLSRVDTEFVVNLKKAKPDLQKSVEEKCETTHNSISGDDTAFNSSHKSNNTILPSQNEKDGGKGKQLLKSLKTKGKETVKIVKEKGKISLADTPQHHLKKCPLLYAPHGTNPRDYLPMIVRFFEDFKFQLQMAQKKCVTFVPWSHPVTSRKKDWQSDKDDGQSTPNKSNKTTQPLSLSLTNSPTIKQQQKETPKDKKEIVEVDLLWKQDCHAAFDSDDQRLFYDSDQNVGPKLSPTVNSLNQTPPHSVTTTPPSTPPHSATTTPLSKHVENSSPLNKDISIEITSSNSSSVISRGRRKRKLLSRQIIGSSDVPATGSKQSNSRQSITSSLPEGPVHHHLFSSSSQDVSDNEELVGSNNQLCNKKSVIDLTELEETAETESCSSHTASQDKQTTCPVCQQLFSKAYIAIHAANCELHVDNTDEDRIPSVASSSKLRQTTLTHKPLSTNVQRRFIESDSDPELMPPIKKKSVTRRRKLLSDMSKRISLVSSKQRDVIDHEVASAAQRSTGNGFTAANTVFKSASLVGQTAVDDIDSYSSEDGTAGRVISTPSSIIDYKNQFSTNPVGKVSKELLMEDNEAFILARKKKWMNTKKGRGRGKVRQRMWKNFKGKGKRKK